MDNCQYVVSKEDGCVMGRGGGEKEAPAGTAHNRHPIPKPTQKKVDHHVGGKDVDGDNRPEADTRKGKGSK